MTATDIARHIGSLTGFVKNSNHKTVEGEVQGAREKIDKFIAALEKSPAGRVERVERHEMEEVRGEDDFRQTY